MRRATGAPHARGMRGGRDEGRERVPQAGASAWLLPARVSIAGNALLWSPPTAGSARGWARPGQGFLASFIALTDGEDDAIAAFARRWGVLSLCKHGLPHTHNPGAGAGPPFSALGGESLLGDDGCRPAFSPDWGQHGWSARTSREPLSAWRQFSALARATLDAAVALRARKPVAPEMWDLLLEPAMMRADDEELLALVVWGWLKVGDVRMGFEWEGRPQTTFVARSMFGGIAREIALTVAAGSVATCSSCGGAYVPPRRPAKNRRHYCPACREGGAPGRDAARDYWHRRGKHRKKGSRR